MTSFEIIPSFDLWAGRPARMRGGDPGSIEELPGDPLELARRWVDAGARWLHVADLDAAVSGVPRNLDLLARIAELEVRLQAGGSLSPEAAGQALARGADRAVLGASLLSNPAALASAMARHGDRVGVAIDVREDRIMARGSSDVGPSVADALDILAEVRPAFATFTSLRGVGAASGPDLEGLAAVARTGVPVLTSGGIRSLDDLRSLAEVQPPLAGAIVGRALHDDVFTYADAVAAVGVR
jgi:phosphoribosylformimino-5-aminoimidazole carboxamide ribonucleotide (ProFAR) isomerase